MARTSLRDLATKGFHIAPGAFDCLSAKLIEITGFPLIYISGYGVSASRLGKPDLGLMTMTEITELAAGIADTTDLPIIADGDTGYGGPLNVARLVKLYENSGIKGIQLEDQQWPKRCGHMNGKKVIPCEEMIAKIKAALDARTKDTLIIARTDAIAVEGFEAALERAALYREAGADMLFVEGPQSPEQLRLLPKHLPAAHIVNMAETGKASRPDDGMVEALGYRIAIYPITALLLTVKAVLSGLSVLHRHKSSAGLQPLMKAYDEFNDLIGMGTYLAKDSAYQSFAAALTETQQGAKKEMEK